MAKKRKPIRNQINLAQLRRIDPLTTNQHDTFKKYDNGSNLVLHGYAGTGKSFISMYLALEEILDAASPFNKIIIIRSVVPSRDMGFLPGSIKEKIRIYEEPYKEIVDDLFGRGDGWDILKMKHLVEFTTTSYLRGLTFNNNIVIVDEIQNMCWGELDTVMTRMGENSRVIFSGDFRQTDLNSIDRKGLSKFINITKKMDNFDYIEFDKKDIVRSGIVKDYIIKKAQYADAQV